ncbi:uncharacterized protein SPPG_00891 [Spizellomyces punctatus DAOM BR117]|uniref:F-box domain-containing protein n=1 Tax=Spizellomyces punctatus (strain DAOM BR117) TaxID=645134 RepID=A0A0L0HQQ8_SPIPD|nr:uncharacterized protein SPPG_00891 [Spizellomyces punctatus DAOM BR117]KND03403.1 hypothetical protein SPPG_00891 [Spizellomyces punctatus DAOM BR117]|eukprot:XP_016611442.1 hypothetical protein SPPG_00891 [Spizellomyces punctatus DAOM BR117]
MYEDSDYDDRGNRGDWRFPSPPPSPPYEPNCLVATDVTRQVTEDSTGTSVSDQNAPPSPPSSPCSFISHSRCSRRNSDLPLCRLPSPISLTCLIDGMDISDDEPPSNSAHTSSKACWPANMPALCLYTICNYLSLSDLSQFYCTSRTMHNSLSSLRPSILSQRLLQGRHLSADLFAAFISGHSPYSHVARDPQSFGGRSKVYARLRRDQHVVDAFVGALVGCVSMARADGTWTLGRRKAQLDSGGGALVDLWDESVARMDAVRALLLLWPIVDAVKRAAESIVPPSLPQPTSTLDRDPTSPSHSLLLPQTLLNTAHLGLAAFPTDALQLTWYISYHAARQVVSRFQLAGWTSPNYHEGMIGPLLFSGRDKLTDMLGSEDDALVWDCVGEFEKWMAVFGGWCPLRGVLENELLARQ